MTWSTNLLALPTLVRVSDVRFDCWFVAADKFILVLTGVVVQLLKLVATANRWLESLLQEVPQPRELVQVFGGEISCWPDPVTCEQRRGPIQIDTKLALGQVRIELSTLSDLAGWFACVCVCVRRAAILNSFMGKFSRWHEPACSRSGRLCNVLG